MRVPASAYADLPWSEHRPAQEVPMTVRLLAAEAESPLNYDPLEIVVGVVAFLVLFLVLRATVFPAFERIYAERADRIEGGAARAEETRKRAAALRQEYEEQLAALRAEAAGIRDEARAEGQRIRVELRERAEAEVARIRQEGEAQLAATREQVIRELRGELGGLSTELAERILGGALVIGPGPAAVVAEFLAETDGRSPGDAARPHG
jgi:F-type H+-transporting ATPase subunit b